MIGAALALAVSAAAAPSPAPGRVMERVLAVVDGRPVLLSEVRAAQRIRGEDAGPALEALIDEHLMYAEASRLPQAAPTADEESRAVAALERQAPEGGDPEALRRMARRQATILKYVDFRFRPQVRITPEQLADARAARGGEEADARRVLEAEDLGRRIESWVAELRKAADVRYTAFTGTGPATR